MSYIVNQPEGWTRLYLIIWKLSFILELNVSSIVTKKWRIAPVNLESLKYIVLQVTCNSHSIKFKIDEDGGKQ